MKNEENFKRLSEQTKCDNEEILDCTKEIEEYMKNIMPDEDGIKQ